MVCTSQGGPLLPFALLHNLSLSALWLFSPLEDGQCSIFVSIPSVRRDLSGFPLALGCSLDESLGWRARGQLQQQMSSLLYVSLIASLTVSILSIVTHCASHPGASGWLPLERMAWHQLPSAAPVILLYYSTLQWGKNPTLSHLAALRAWPRRKRIPLTAPAFAAQQLCTLQTLIMKYLLLFANGGGWNC